jgi:hypothetical protein
MIRLELTRSQAETLLQLLKYYHSELRMEIAATEEMDFREQLKSEKKVLKEIREHLAQLLETETAQPSAVEG